MIKTVLIVESGYLALKRKPKEMEALPTANSMSPIWKMVFLPKREITFDVTTVPISLTEMSKVGISSFSSPWAIF